MAINTKIPTNRGLKVHCAQLEQKYIKLEAINADLITALDSAVEVMEFAYMSAPKQPRQIAEARTAIRKAKAN